MSVDVKMCCKLSVPDRGECVFQHTRTIVKKNDLQVKLQRIFDIAQTSLKTHFLHNSKYTYAIGSVPAQQAHGGIMA
jgi:hypothetical protein